MLHTVIGRLRVIAFAEGISWLVLAGIAMPLKYLAGNPVLIRPIGMLHGILFIAFCLALAAAMWRARWSMRFAALVFLSSLVPFGTFVMDRRLREQDEPAR